MDPPDPEPLADVQLALALILVLLAGFLVHDAVAADRPDPPAAATAPYRVHLNQAPAGELRAIPGVGAVLAQRIIDERCRAPFTSVSDLARVHGIGPVLVDRIRPHVVVEAPGPGR